MSSLSLAVTQAVVARIESEWGRSIHATEPGPEAEHHTRVAIVAGEGSPGAAAFGLKAETITLDILVRLPDGETTARLKSQVDALLAAVDGWTPTVSGYASTPVSVVVQQTGGNRGDQGQWRIRGAVSLIPSAGDPLITSEDADVDLSSATDLNVVAFSFREGVQLSRGTRLGTDGFPSIKAGEKYGNGRFILSGNDWPPAPGAYSAVFTLGAGIETRTRTLFIDSFELLVDARSVGGVIVFEVPFNFTYDSELA